MSRQYQYVEINGYHFCLQQNPVFLAWILFFKIDTLIAIFKPWLERKIPIFTFTYARHYLGLIKANIKTFIIFILYKSKLRYNSSLTNLPVYGQVCMPVHKGYKVFNLQRGVVVKIFDHDISKLNIENEIEYLKTISQIDFAPTLKKWNVYERWYEEEYIFGSIDSLHRSHDSAILLNKFFNEIIPCLSILMLLRSPISKTSNDYAREILDKLEACMSSQKILAEKGIDRIKGFIYTMVERLNVLGNSPVQIVFTHGDFCPANILKTKKGIKIVDWESAAFRSMLFDFYSYFFYRPVCRKISVHKVASEIKEALPLFISKLASKDSKFAVNGSTAETTYRSLYYIEFVCKLMERQMTEKRLDIMDFIFRYIEAFNNYDNVAEENH
jgi:hypothetical protein